MSDVKVVSIKRAVFNKLKMTVVLGDDGTTYIQRSHAAKGLNTVSQTFVYRLDGLTGSAGVAIQLDDELPRGSWRKFLSVSHINDYCRLLAKRGAYKKQADPEFVKWINETVFFEPQIRLASIADDNELQDILGHDVVFGGNDDTPAQTFGDIKWDIGTGEKCEAILVTVCSKCGSTVPVDTDSVAKPALSRWAARFLLALAAICFAFLFFILALVLFEQLDIDHIFFKAVAFITTLGFLFLFLYFYLSEEVSE